jgi:hypothetical protein
VREKGTNRSQFFRGQVDKYTWVDVGSSYLPSEILAAFLYAQLEHMPEIARLRRHIYERYYAGLQPLADRGLLTLPIVPPDCGTNHHLFHVTGRRSGYPHGAARAPDSARAFSRHSTTCRCTPRRSGFAYGHREGMLPITESVSDRLLRLPFYAGMSEEDNCHCGGRAQRISTGPPSARLNPVAVRGCDTATTFPPYPQIRLGSMLLEEHIAEIGRRSDEEVVVRRAAIQLPIEQDGTRRQPFGHSRPVGIAPLYDHLEVREVEIGDTPPLCLIPARGSAGTPEWRKCGEALPIITRRLAGLLPCGGAPRRTAVSPQQTPRISTCWRRPTPEPRAMATHSSRCRGAVGRSKTSSHMGTKNTPRRS